MEALVVNIFNDTKLKDFEKYLHASTVVAIGDVSHDYADYVKEQYLSGQKLQVRTGMTRDSVKAWYVKKTRGKNAGITWSVKVGIKAISQKPRTLGRQVNLNYLNRWNVTSKEFMKPSFLMYKDRVKRESEQKVGECWKWIHKS